MGGDHQKTVGRTGSRMFQILFHQPDGLCAKDILSRLEKLVPPSAFEDTTYANRPQVRRYEKVVRFSTIGGNASPPVCCPLLSVLPY